MISPPESVPGNVGVASDPVSRPGSLLKPFIAGVCSGTCSAVLFQPLDLIKTRIQTSVKKGHGPSSMPSVCYSVVRQNKITGLWTGLVPSLYRMVPGIGIYFTCIHYLRSKFESKYPRPLASFLIGGTSRTVGALCVLPFTVLKTRYESGSFNYDRVLKALVVVYKTEGVRGLFSGVSPTLIRDVPYSGLYFMFYSQMNRLFSFSLPDSTDLPYIHFISGISAGALASVVTQPADVVKTHMQLYPSKYGQLKDVLVFVYEKDGVVGFWRGLLPRMIRRTLMAAMTWTVYEEVMKKYGLK